MSSHDEGYLPPAERIRRLQEQRRAIDIDELQRLQIIANAAGVDGLDRNAGIQRLRREGCPALMAAELMDEALKARKQRMRGSGLTQLVGSAIGIVLAFVIWQSMGDYGSWDDDGTYIEGRGARRLESRVRVICAVLFFGGFAGATNGAITLWRGEEDGPESDVISD